MNRHVRTTALALALVFSSCDGSGTASSPAEASTSGSETLAYLEALVTRSAQDVELQDLAEQVGAETPEDNVDFLLAVRQLSTNERERALATYHLVLLSLRGQGPQDPDEIGVLTADLSGPFATVEVGGRTLLDRARGRVTGRDAMGETHGEDFDGVPFELEDYRGKVVLISFWGAWCPPCRALFPP